MNISYFYPYVFEVFRQVFRHFFGQGSHENLFAFFGAIINLADKVIDPEDSRKYLVGALETYANIF